MLIEFETDTLTPVDAAILLQLVFRTHPDLFVTVSHTMFGADVNPAPAPAAPPRPLQSFHHDPDGGDFGGGDNEEDDVRYDAGGNPIPPEAAAEIFDAPPPALDPAAVFAAQAPLDGAVPPGGAPTPPPVGAPTIPVVGVEVDKDGLPWDARIHAGTKSKNADGRWKGKKGVDDAVKAAVRAELAAIMSAPVPQSVGATAPLAAPPPPAPPSPAGTAAFPPGGDAAPAPAVAFAAAARKAATMQNDGKINTQDVQGYIVSLGLSSMADLLKRPDMIPAFEAMLDSHGQ